MIGCNGLSQPKEEFMYQLQLAQIGLFVFVGFALQL